MQSTFPAFLFKPNAPCLTDIIVTDRNIGAVYKHSFHMRASAYHEWETLSKFISKDCKTMRRHPFADHHCLLRGAASPHSSIKWRHAGAFGRRLEDLRNHTAAASDSSRLQRKTGRDESSSDAVVLRHPFAVRLSPVKSQLLSLLCCAFRQLPVWDTFLLSTLLSQTWPL